MLNLSKHVLTDSEQAVLVKWFSLSVTYPQLNLVMACAVQFVVSEFPQTEHRIQAEDQARVREVLSLLCLT
jgi:hypothetical protein